MTIENKLLEDLIPYENNPRINDGAVDAVAASIKEFGFKVPIVIDKDNIIVAGHTRHLAAKKLGMVEVPVIVADDLTDDQIKAFRLADNKVGEMALWDFEKLEAEMQDIEMELSQFGFDMKKLQVEFDKHQTVQDDNFDAEEAYEEIDEPMSKAGDVWLLGNHRLMCGDSTKKSDVATLMDGAKADLLQTDPPYNVAYEGTAGTIQNDNMSDKKFKEFLTAAFKRAWESLKEGAAFYVWLASREHVNFETSLNAAGFEVRQQLIWNKSSLVLGRQDYQWKHEPCLYGWKDGAAHYFVDSRIETTVIDDNPNLKKMSKEELIDYIKELKQAFPASTVIDEDKPARNGEHPTMKPLKLIGYQIQNSSRPEESVLDLFGGSGSTLIACEQLNRKCYMMEFDPKYCDVIINRWEALTGKKAQLEGVE